MWQIHRSVLNLLLRNFCTTVLILSPLNFTRKRAGIKKKQHWTHEKSLKIISSREYWDVMSKSCHSNLKLHCCGHCIGGMIPPGYISAGILFHDLLFSFPCSWKLSLSFNENKNTAGQEHHPLENNEFFTLHEIT